MSENNTKIPAGKKGTRKFLVIAIVAVITIAAITGGSVFAYNSQPAVRMQNALELGANYLSELDFEMAIASFKEAIEIDPTEVQAYRGLINVYAQQGNYQEVVNQYNAAAENVSEDALEGLRGDVIAALQNGAERANANGDYGSAGFCYEQILVIDAGNLNAREKLFEIYLILAENAQNEGDYDEAAGYCDKILSFDSEHEKAKEKLCEVYLLMAEQEKNGGNYDKAIEYCDKALALNPEYAAANKKLCDIYLIIANNAANEKDYIKALEYYNKILALYPFDREVPKKLCEVYLAMAANAESEGRYEEAVEYCNRILSLNPNSTEAVDMLIGLYLILAEQSNYDEAMEYYDKILALDWNHQGALKGIAGINENVQLIDELYEKLVSNDYESVLAIISAEGFLDECAVYEYEEWAQWARRESETAYRLPTSDGTLLGVISHFYADDPEQNEIHVFYCPHTDEGSISWHGNGFEYLGYGDYYATTTGYWSDGQNMYYPDGRVIPYEGEDYISMVWHV